MEMLKPNFKIWRADVKRRKLKEPTLEYIAKHVFVVTGYSLGNIKTNVRFAEVIFAKHLFIWLARNYTTRTLKDIANYVGLQNHTTCINAISKIDDYLCYDNDKKIIILECKRHFEFIYKKIFHSRELVVHLKDGRILNFENAAIAATFFKKQKSYIHNILNGNRSKPDNIIKINYKYGKEDTVSSSNDFV